MRRSAFTLLALVLCGRTATAQAHPQSSAQSAPADTLPAQVLNRAIVAFNRNDARAFAAFFDATFRHAFLASDTAGTPQPLPPDMLLAQMTPYFKNQKHPPRVTLEHSMVVGPFIAWEYRIVDDSGTKRALDVLEVRHGKFVTEWEQRSGYTQARSPTDAASSAGSKGQRMALLARRRD